MRVLFVSANRSEVNMRTIPLGMACVAEAARQAGHEVCTLDLMQVADASGRIRDAIGRMEPDAIGVSIRNIDDQNLRSPHLFLPDANGIIAAIKDVARAPIILGGAGYSIFPEATLDGSQADMGICGEGEEALPLLLERLESGQSLSGVPGLYVKGKGLQGERLFESDPDRVPLPGADLLPLGCTSDPVVPVQTRRGCPFGCSYCPNPLIEGRVIRRRSPEKVVEWIARLGGQGVRRFYFVDNAFNLPPSYARELCRRLAAMPRPVSWTSIVYPLKFEEELAALMAEAGCAEVSLGFESGCGRLLKGMNKRFGLADVVHTRQAIRKAGIRCMGFLLLGGPGETRDSVRESLAFADSLELDSLKVTVGIRIYPGTRLEGIARREGVVAPGDDLLSPRFYMTPGLDDFIRETAAAYAAGRRSWIIDR